MSSLLIRTHAYPLSDGNWTINVTSTGDRYAVSKKEGATAARLYRNGMQLGPAITMPANESIRALYGKDVLTGTYSDGGTHWTLNTSTNQWSSAPLSTGVNIYDSTGDAILLASGSTTVYLNWLQNQFKLLDLGVDLSSGRPYGNAIGFVYDSTNLGLVIDPVGSPVVQPIPCPDGTTMVQSAYPSSSQDLAILVSDGTNYQVYSYISGTPTKLTLPKAFPVSAGPASVDVGSVSLGGDRVIFYDQSDPSHVVTFIVSNGAPTRVRVDGADVKRLYVSDTWTVGMAIESLTGQVDDVAFVSVPG